MADKPAVRKKFFGKTGVGQSGLEGTIRILSVQETYAVMMDFMARTGLKREQYAPNSWGYPYIPIPEVRRGYGRVRTAPREVTKSYFGHPIYWIDPALTERRPGEGESEWSIRMFFLIDAFGYWNKKVEFIDFLKVNEFSFSDAQIETYHRIADDGSEVDNYTFLSEKDLDIPLEEAEKNYEEALEYCMKIQERESRELLRSQSAQYSFAEKALGKNVRQWTSSFDDEGSIWDRKFEFPLSEIANTYNDRYKNEIQTVTDLLKETRVLYDKLEKVIIRYNHASSILELPVRASIKGNPGGAALIAYMASAMKQANESDNIRKVALAKVDEKIKESLTGGNKGVGEYDQIIRAMRSAYSTAWNRMRLAFINYQNLQNEEEILTSKVELESYLQSGSFKNSNTPKKGDSISSNKGITSFDSIISKDFS